MKIFLIIIGLIVVVYWWMFFAALQEDKMLTQKELEELANALWESDDDDES